MCHPSPANDDTHANYYSPTTGAIVRHYCDNVTSDVGLVSAVVGHLRFPVDPWT